MQAGFNSAAERGRAIFALLFDAPLGLVSLQLSVHPQTLTKLYAPLTNSLRSLLQNLRPSFYITKLLRQPAAMHIREPERDTTTVDKLFG
jgi:hypothetical protein